ncbi:hypothetical protein Tco_0593732 [Tanacetum coccineum]
MQTQEDHSNTVQELNVDSLKVDLVVIQNTCSEKEDSNSETASNKSVKESSLDSATKDVHAIKYKMSKAKERCMTYFRSLHSHLQVLSKEDLKGTRIEHGFKRAFMSVFGQDNDTFTSTMFLNVDQLQKQLDKDDFQENGSMAAFWVINRQFQKFIDLKFTLDYDSQMSDKYFAEYTRIEVKQFRETLLQHKSNVKKFVAERIRHQRQYEKESNETESEVQDDNSRSGNDIDADDAYIRPIYDEEPMAEIQGKVFAIAALKNDLRKLKGNSVDTKFAKTSVLGKPVLQSLRNQSVVRQLNTFKSERPQMSKPRFASQVDVNKNLLRPIFTRNRFSPNKTSTVYKKTSPRSDLRWKPTGRIFKSVGLRWIPTGNLFDSCISKVNSEPTHGSNVDIPNIHESKQTLDLSAGTSINVQKEQSLDLSAGILCNVNKENLRVWLLKKLIS